MKRKGYEKPAMKVAKLQHQCRILAGSVASAGVQNYTTNDYYEE